jgi:20S proteasome alpha/beta subunit
MGSGSMAAMAVFESGYKENLTVRWTHQSHTADLCTDITLRVISAPTSY